MSNPFVVNMTMEELEQAVTSWGIDKGILPNGKPSAQFSKTLEEVAELCTALEDRDEAEIEDAIGDIMVTLIMQCNLWNMSLKSCLGSAYNVISKRTGRMVNGVFVKDGN